MPEVDLDFHDRRISMNYWWPRVEGLDINTPETVLVPLKPIMEGDGDPDLSALIEAAESLSADSYFIRGDKKSARVLEEGGFLNSLDEEVVNFTFFCLLDSLMMGSQPTNSIAVREQLDLDTVTTSYGDPIAPEVRVFVDNGEVLCHHSRVTEQDLGIPEDGESKGGDLGDLLEDVDGDFETDTEEPDYSEEREQLESIQNTIESEFEDKVRPQAELVANEFSDSGWSVDFLRTSDGEWHLTDMALYGLYFYNMDEDEEGHWKSLSAHPNENCPHNLETNPPEDLPDEPENARTERAIGSPL